MSTLQVVVITGASAGIARATARLFAAREARIGLFARGQAGLDGATGAAIGGVGMTVTLASNALARRLRS